MIGDLTENFLELSKCWK